MKRIAVLLFAALLGMASAQAAHQPTWATQQKKVGGLVVNFGIVPAGNLSRFPSEASHGASFPPGSQHLVVSLSDAKTGQHLENAKVSARIRDPKGNVEHKDLAAGRTGEFSDYSSVFTFGYSGKYRVELTIEPRGGKPVHTSFVVDHSI